MYTFFPHQQLTITINYLGTINTVSQTNEYKKSHFKYVRDVCHITFKLPTLFMGSCLCFKTCLIDNLILTMNNRL